MRPVLPAEIAPHVEPTVSVSDWAALASRETSAKPCGLVTPVVIENVPKVSTVGTEALPMMRRPPPLRSRTVVEAVPPYDEVGVPPTVTAMYSLLLIA